MVNFLNNLTSNAHQAGQIVGRRDGTMEGDDQIVNAGTTYETNAGKAREYVYGDGPSFDPRSYMYGRDVNGAENAVNHANAIGGQAFATGNQILQQDTGLAADARSRTAPVGDFTGQNAALRQSLNYGRNLAGLEATQGPSSAQAQLQTGTNQALASQLALARSGRGFGGNAAAMGQAQGNIAGIQANAANEAAMLRAQEDASWRGRQAANFGNAAAISQGAGTQFGQQANTNINAYLQNQGQNDTASLGYLGQGATAYGQGVAGNFAGQGLAHNVRVAEMGAGQAQDDRMLRAWAAANGHDLQEKQANAQQTAALIQGGATLAAALL